MWVAIAHMLYQNQGLYTTQSPLYKTIQFTGLASSCPVPEAGLKPVLFHFLQEIKKSWFKKAAEEAELIVSSESEDENFANSADKTASTKGAIQVHNMEH